MINVTFIIFFNLGIYEWNCTIDTSCFAQLPHFIIYNENNFLVLHKMYTQAQKWMKFMYRIKTP